MKKYVIKIGKMYVQEIYIQEDAIDTDFIREIEFTNCKKQAYYKVNECEANIIIDKLERILNIYIEDLFEIEEVEDEERE